MELSVSEEIERFGKKSGKCTGFLVESCFFRIQSPLPLRASFSWHLHREKTLTNYNWKDEGQLMLQISISYIRLTDVVFLIFLIKELGLPQLKSKQSGLHGEDRIRPLFLRRTHVTQRHQGLLASCNYESPASPTAAGSDLRFTIQEAEM